MLSILNPHAERSQFSEPINANDCNCHSNDVSSQDKDKQFNSVFQENRSAHQVERRKTVTIISQKSLHLCASVCGSWLGILPWKMFSELPSSRIRLGPAPLPVPTASPHLGGQPDAHTLSCLLWKVSTLSLRDQDGLPHLPLVLPGSKLQALFLLH